ncbi:hypothetical protein [Reichenbachiella versicolor]|uniref:hypothetical protein n=1 Tax=Reichenbachiella versicolor TaxID=1821036 RepID=UPI000D6EB006|nr:hypothetical protein [Reichenbachiella versicolor]
MEFNIGGEYDLKISSKKLKSGKCQVKFHAHMREKKKMYGYILADKGETLTNVVEKIVTRLDKVNSRDNLHHINLFSLGGVKSQASNMVMFEA